jgi:hypothetical protein
MYARFLSKLAHCAALVPWFFACASEDHQVGSAAMGGSSTGGAGTDRGGADAGGMTNQGGTRPSSTGGRTNQGGSPALGGTGAGEAGGAAGRDPATGGAAAQGPGGAGSGGSGETGGMGGNGGSGGAGNSGGMPPGGSSSGGAAGAVTNPCPDLACNDQGTCVEAPLWKTCQCDGIADLPLCEGARFRNLGVSRNWSDFGLGALTDDGRLAIGCATTMGDSSSHAISWTLAGGVVPFDVPQARCATTMNGDGSVIVGTRTDDSAFIWTQSGVEYPTLPGAIWGLSDDGSVYFGTDINIPYRAFYVVRGQAPIVLGDDTYATSLSGDGEHLVGYINSGVSPFHFTRERGVEPLPMPANSQDTFATHVSPDGSLIVGYAEYSDDEPSVPVLWENGVLVTADVLRAPLGESVGAVNSTWTAAGGSHYFYETGQSEATFWKKGVGWRLLRDILSDTVVGWTFITINAISADGKKLIGLGIGPDERWYRFYAELP